MQEQIGTRRGTSTPRSGARSAMRTWLLVRVGHVALLYGLGWIITWATGTSLIETGVGAALGLGIFLALPLTVIVSAIAWAGGAASTRTRGSLRVLLLSIATIVEFTAALLLNLSWTPAAPWIVAIDIVLAAVLATAVPRVYRRPRIHAE